MYYENGLEATYCERRAAGLSRFHGRRFAVVLTVGGSDLAVRANARYVNDNEGSALRIEVDDESQAGSGKPVFIIREESWDRCFVRDHEYGCEYQLRLNADPVPVGS